MLSPVQAITAGALTLTISAAFLIAQPFEQEAVTPPGAEAGADLAPPTAFTAVYASGPSVRSEEWTGATGGGNRFVDGAWEWRVTDEATDPRLRGVTYVAWNHDEYAGDLGTQEDDMTVSHTTLRIENEGGAWQGVPQLDLNEDPTSSQVLIGEGDYEGLYVVAVLESATELGSDTWTLRGYIFEGDPLPAPEPFVSE
jgi:hypothetical protein